MACSSSSLSQREGTTDGRTSILQEDALATEARWEKVLADPSLRRLLRDGHRTEATTSLLKQLEEDV